MNICIDVSAVPYGTGVSKYTACLVRALTTLITKDDNLSVFGVSFRQYRKMHNYAGDLKFQNRYFYLLPPKLMTIILNDWEVEVSRFIGDASVFHSWDWYLPRSNKVKVVVTMHDLAMFKFPYIAHPEILAHHKQVMARIKKYKPEVIAISETTKKDLINLFDLPPEIITVVYEALPILEQIPFFEEQNKEWEIIERRIGYKPFFLMVGTLEPRKNHIAQILAWRRYKKEFNLVIVGKDGWQNIDNEDGIVRIKYITDKTLACLFDKASLLLYCSLYEGFGLPILEAFYHQLPVLSSNNSGMKEVAGESAVLVDPCSVEEIREGINTVLKDKKVLIAKGNNRLSSFSWEKTAIETMKVYQK